VIITISLSDRPRFLVEQTHKDTVEFPPSTLNPQPSALNPQP
jgi:hypothetical protein